MTNNIAVGLGEIKMSKDPGDVLVAFGLGSCVGIGMYDPVLHLGALLHAVLPLSANGNEPASPKYVDTGVQMMLDMLIKAGALKSRLVLKMAGGANMLTAPGLSNTFDIGSRNANSAHTVLSNLGLRLVNEEIGGNTGRTVRMYVINGRMTIRMMGTPERDF
jgi:chemotaxis protein CheD